MDEPSRWRDLVSEMYAAVWEEAPLHEITLGTVDLLSGDRKVVHGPWSAEECQAVLIPGHVAGWIELIADVEPPWSLTSADWQARASRDGAFLVLSAEDATALLSDLGRWILGSADGHAMLCRTDEVQLRTWTPSSTSAVRMCGVATDRFADRLDPATYRDDPVVGIFERNLENRMPCGSRNGCSVD